MLDYLKEKQNFTHDLKEHTFEQKWHDTVLLLSNCDWLQQRWHVAFWKGGPQCIWLILLSDADWLVITYLADLVSEALSNMESDWLLRLSGKSISVKGMVPTRCTRVLYTTWLGLALFKGGQVDLWIHYRINILQENFLFLVIIHYLYSSGKLTRLVISLQIIYLIHFSNCSYSNIKTLPWIIVWNSRKQCLTMTFSKAPGLGRLSTVVSAGQPAHAPCFYMLKAATASL